MAAGLATIGKGLAAAVLLGLGGLLALSRIDPSGTQGAPVSGEGTPLAAPGPQAQSAAMVVDTNCGGTDDMVIPVQGVGRRQLSDTFTDARSEGRRHDAIDIMAPRGTPVLAAAEGRVEKLFLSRAGGNTVYVRSPDGRIQYYYAHLDSYARGLREGQTVLRGTRIGTVGFSGNADPAAPHLHFAVMATEPLRNWWEQARPLNPFRFLTAAGECPGGR